MSYCAIFDLDETLIKTKSMIAVMREYYIQSSFIKLFGYFRFKQFQNRLHVFAKDSPDRKALNRQYYQNLSGLRIDKILQASNQWFFKNSEHLFNQTILNEIDNHRINGAEIIVVTGSFSECIAPIVNHLGITHVVCAKLEKKNNRYTGEMLSEPTIGEGKANALLNYANKYQLSLKNSYAYGDHESDIPMLSLAEHPVAVGNNSILLQHAKVNNWSTLTTTEK